MRACIFYRYEEKFGFQAAEEKVEVPKCKDRNAGADYKMYTNFDFSAVGEFRPYF